MAKKNTEVNWQFSDHKSTAERAAAERADPDLDPDPNEEKQEQEQEQDILGFP